MLTLKQVIFVLFFCVACSIHASDSDWNGGLSQQNCLYRRYSRRYCTNPSIVVLTGRQQTRTNQPHEPPNFWNQCEALCDDPDCAAAFITMLSRWNYWLLRCHIVSKSDGPCILKFGRVAFASMRDDLDCTWTHAPTTSKPSRSPTPTQPSKAPTPTQPTIAPIFSSPSLSPILSAPSLFPTTEEPSVSPTATAPTMSPLAVDRWVDVGDGRCTDENANRVYQVINSYFDTTFVEDLSSCQQICVDNGGCLGLQYLDLRICTIFTYNTDSSQVPSGFIWESGSDNSKAIAGTDGQSGWQCWSYDNAACPQEKNLNWDVGSETRFTNSNAIGYRIASPVDFTLSSIIQMDIYGSNMQCYIVAYLDEGNLHGSFITQSSNVMLPTSLGTEVEYVFTSPLTLTANTNYYIMRFCSGTPTYNVDSSFGEKTNGGWTSQSVYFSWNPNLFTTGSHDTGDATISESASHRQYWTLKCEGSTQPMITSDPTVAPTSPTTSPSASFPTTVPTVAPTSPTISPSMPGDCRWEPIHSSQCPESYFIRMMGECTLDMDPEQLCEADGPLPDGNEQFDVNNCGQYDVFTVVCGDDNAGEPECNPDWVAITDPSECPSGNLSTMPECTTNMVLGDLCEADRSLPNGERNFNINNCGPYDVFRYQCTGEDDDKPECNPDWVALTDPSECPSGDLSTMPECTTNMALGDLCEADRSLPNGEGNFNIDNCGPYDVFRYQCTGDGY